MRPVPPQVAGLTKSFEGLRLDRYLDVAGNPTIGYGHLIRDTDPAIVQKGPIGQVIADSLLESDLNETAQEICHELGDAVNRLTDGQYGALIDFVFNEGIGRFVHSTLCNKILSGDLKAAAPQFMLWIYGHVNGKLVVLEDLQRRRKAELDLWNS